VNSTAPLRGWRPFHHAMPHTTTHHLPLALRGNPYDVVCGMMAYPPGSGEPPRHCPISLLRARPQGHRTVWTGHFSPSPCYPTTYSVRLTPTGFRTVRWLPERLTGCLLDVDGYYRCPDGTAYHGRRYQFCRNVSFSSQPVSALFLPDVFGWYICDI